MPKGWYSLKAQEQEQADYAAELFIYDEIGGWGVTANQLIGQLKGIKGRILLRLNTPGGSVMEAVALYNYLRTRKEGVDTVVDGWALSAGSLLLLAGERRTIGEASMIMVHSAWGMALGNGDDMRKQAELLDKVNAQLATIYAARTGQSDETVANWLADTDGHWFTGAEAVELGFATDTFEALKVAAHFDPAAFAAKYQAPAAALECFEPTQEELMKLAELEAALSAAQTELEAARRQIAALETAAADAQAEADARIAEAEALAADLSKANGSLSDALTAAEEALDAHVCEQITARVDALVTEGRIKAEGRDALLDACLEADDGGESLLAAIPEAAPVRAAPVIVKPSISTGPKTVTRSDWDAMSHSERAAFAKSGGKITE